MVKPAMKDKSRRKKSFISRLMTGFIGLLIVLILLLVGFLYVPFKPFDSLRTLWVTTAMTTLNHQYLATWLFSDEKINVILEANKPADLGNSDPSLINTFRLTGLNRIKLIDVSQNGFKGYFLEVNNPAHVKVAATQYLGDRGQKAEEIASEYEAKAVINGGAFSDPSGKGKGGEPRGILISNNEILVRDSLSTYAIIGMDQDNVLILGKYTYKELKELNLRDAVSFGPFLVVNGEPAITQGDGGWGLAPRTAIGQKKDGTILMLVIDGRQVGSIGATLKDVQEIMLEYGAFNAANLDGGASSVLYYKNKIINNPCSQYGERNAPSFFIVD